MPETNWCREGFHENSNNFAGVRGKEFILKIIRLDMTQIKHWRITISPHTNSNNNNQLIVSHSSISTLNLFVISLNFIFSSIDFFLISFRDSTARRYFEFLCGIKESFWYTLHGRIIHERKNEKKKRRGRRKISIRCGKK